MGFLDLAFGSRDYLSPEGEFDPAAYRRSRFGDAIGDLSAGLIAYGMGQPAQAAAAFGRMGRSDPTEPFKLSMMSAQAKKAQADAARTAASQQLMSNPQGLLALGLSQEQAQTIGLLGMIDPGKAAEALQKWVSPEKTFGDPQVYRDPNTGALSGRRYDNRGGYVDVPLPGTPTTFGAVDPALVDPKLGQAKVAMAGRTAAAEAGARQPFELDRMRTQSELNTGEAWRRPMSVSPGTSVLDPSQLGGRAVGSSFTDRIVQYESAGDPNARNPRSSATGAGQFINSTWLDLVKRNRPDLAQGKTDEQILTLRSDPQLSREMIGVYAGENAGELRAAGLPDTDTNLALAHAFGSAGARKILTVVPSTPMTMAVPADVIRANPHLANMTTGQVIAQAQQRFGGAAPAPAAQPGVLYTAPQAQQPGQAFANANTLRDEFNTLTKDYRTVVDAHRKIHAAADTGQGDMSLLYSFVKLLDPGSVVRESEFATAAATGSLGQRIQGLYESWVSGGRLTPEVRRGLLAEADAILSQQQRGYETVANQYRTLAQRSGLNPDDVAFNYGAGTTASSPAAPGGTATRRFNPATGKIE